MLHSLFCSCRYDGSWCSLNKCNVWRYFSAHYPKAARGIVNVFFFNPFVILPCGTNSSIILTMTLFLDNFVIKYVKHKNKAGEVTFFAMMTI